MTLHTCFGMACPLRRTCARYLAVDTSPGVSTSQATCRSEKSYPDYIEAVPSDPGPRDLTRDLFDSPAADVAGAILTRSDRA